MGGAWSAGGPRYPPSRPASSTGPRDTYTDVKFKMYQWLAAQTEACPFKGDFHLAGAVGELLRFVGHDFMADNKVDGCFALNHPENKGLDYALSVAGPQRHQVCPKELSTADCMVLLAQAAMDFTVEGARPGTSDTPITATSRPFGRAKCDDVGPEVGTHRRLLNEDGQEEDGECPFTAAKWAPGVLDFKTRLGRQDTPLQDCMVGSELAQNTHISGLNPGGGGPPLDINHSLDFNLLLQVVGGGEPKLVDGTLQTPCGFSDANLVAMMGVHTIGRAHAGISGFDGFWVNPAKGANGLAGCEDGDLGCGPSLFNNQYYKDFFRMGWKKVDHPRNQWVCVPGSTGVDVESLIPVADAGDKPERGTFVTGDKLDVDECFPGSLRLPADMAIMFDLTEEDKECLWVEVAPGKVQSTCKLQDIWDESLEYAESDTVWLTAFRDAWKVMTECNQQGLQPEVTPSQEFFELSKVDSKYYGQQGLQPAADLLTCAGVCSEYEGKGFSSSNPFPSAMC